MIIARENGFQVNWHIRTHHWVSSPNSSIPARFYYMHPRVFYVYALLACVQAYVCWCFHFMWSNYVGQLDILSLTIVPFSQDIILKLLIFFVWWTRSQILLSPAYLFPIYYVRVCDHMWVYVCSFMRHSLFPSKSVYSLVNKLFLKKKREVLHSYVRLFRIM